MVLSFLLAAAAGFAVPYVVPTFRRALATALKSDARIEASDAQILTLLLLLAVSALLTAGAGVNTVSLATVLGGAAGYFGRPLVAFLRDPDGTDVPEEKRWDGRVRATQSDEPPDAADAEVIEAVEDALRAQPGQTATQNDQKEPGR